MATFFFMDLYRSTETSSILKKFVSYFRVWHLISNCLNWCSFENEWFYFVILLWFFSKFDPFYKRYVSNCPVIIDRIFCFRYSVIVFSSYVIFSYSVFVKFLYCWVYYLWYLYTFLRVKTNFGLYLVSLYKTWLVKPF